MFISPFCIEQIGSVEARAYLLHEALGALGYLDERYEVSVALDAINYAKPALRSSADLAPLREIAGRLVKRGRKRIDYRAGTDGYLEIKELVALGKEGGTGVGGGGEPLAVRIKLALIRPDFIERPAGIAVAELNRRIALLDLEVTDDLADTDAFSWAHAPGEIAGRFKISRRYWIDTKTEFAPSRVTQLKRMLEIIAKP